MNPKDLPDRFVTCPAEPTFVVKDLLEEGDRPMQNPDGTPLIYSWRKMIMSAVMTDPRLMEGALLIDHLERAELVAIARGAPREIVRVGGRALECLQKVLLTSPAFDMHMGKGQIMHGYIAQHPEMQAWFSLLLDAPSKDPRSTSAADASRPSTASREARS